MYSLSQLQDKSFLDLIKLISKDQIGQYSALIPKIPILRLLNNYYIAQDYPAIEHYIRQSNIQLAKNNGLYEKLMTSLEKLEIKGKSFSDFTETEKEEIVFSKNISATESKPLLEIYKYIDEENEKLKMSSMFRINAPHHYSVMGNDKVNVEIPFLLMIDAKDGTITSGGISYSAYEDFLNSTTPFDVSFKEYWRSQIADNGSNFAFKDKYDSLPSLEEILDIPQ